jgi:hypothetical protein
MDIKTERLPLATWTNKVLLAACACDKCLELMARLLDAKTQD